MSSDTFLMSSFAIMVGLFVVMIAVGIPRGKRMQQTNEQIAANQLKLLENSRKQTKALERIASALEKH